MSLFRMLLDTNILLRNALPEDPLHDVVRQAVLHLINTGWDLCISTQNLIEYWVVATRPRAVNGMGRTVSETLQDIQGFRDAFTLLADPPDLIERWLNLCSSHNVHGRPAHDARMVAVMEAHGVDRILTLNPGDLICYGHVTVLSPADVY